MLTVFIGAIIVGLILGLLGSGGSAVMVPILVYLVGHDAKISIAESLATVGVISIIGSIPFARAKLVDWKSVFFFGVPSMLGTFVGALLGGMAPDAAQLIVFGVVLLLAAVLMIKKAFFGTGSADEQEHGPGSHSLAHIGMIVCEGLVVGVLTGFVGVGGGFLIVPALFILGKLPMRTAIGTSLVIIIMKSAVGFLKYQHDLSLQNLSVDWTTIGIFIVIGTIGCLVGQKINSRLNQQALKQVFAVFLVLLGGFIIYRETSKLIQPAEPATVELSQISLGNK